MKEKKKSTGGKTKMAKAIKIHKNRGMFTLGEVLYLLEKAKVKYDIVETDDDLHEKYKKDDKDKEEKK